MKNTKAGAACHTAATFANDAGFVSIAPSRKTTTAKGAMMATKSNMYDFVTGTWNPIGGECPHACSYCYVKSNNRPAVKKKYTGEPRFIDHELKKSLGKNKFWFVCSMMDLFADTIPVDWIFRITERMLCCPDNRYLIQTKNPGRILSLGYHNRLNSLMENVIFGTTIETNRRYPEMGNAPEVNDRAAVLNELSHEFKTMVTIEPIVDFDPKILPGIVWYCNPEWVNIGADSKGHNLPEPSADKIKGLIDNLRNDGIEVKLKSNLKRLIGEFPK